MRNGNFDFQFPIDIDFPLEEDFSTCKTAADAVSRLKLAVPYTFRYESDGRRRQPHPEISGAPVQLPVGPTTARKILARVVESLPSGWQATALPGRLLLYRETEDGYPSGQLLGRSPS